MKRLLILLFSLALTHTALAAEVSVFLIPIVDHHDELTLRDIARLECPAAVQDELYAIPIGSELYRDGYIDRKEVYTLLRKHSAGRVTVYGNAIRVLADSDIAPVPEKHNRIQSGSVLHVVVKKRGVSVEITGTALEEGKRGDEIRFKIGNRRLKGRVADKKRVEVTL